MYYANTSNDLSSSIAKFLNTKKDMTDENQYYHTFKNKVYMLNVKKIMVDERTHYSCILKISTPPIINNRFGIFYQKRSEVEEIFTTKLYLLNLFKRKQKKSATNQEFLQFYHYRRRDRNRQIQYCLSDLFESRNA